MTHDALSPKSDNFQEVSSTNTDNIDYPENPLSSSLLEDALHALVPADASRESFEEEEQSRLATGSWKFQKTLKELSALEVPAKEYIEQYLRDLHRRQCTANTMRQSFATISSFMSFASSTGKEHLEQVSREDLMCWIEHDQDRGLSPSTVNLRLSTLKAFLRYFEAREMVAPSVLAKRLSVKVPDSLPRAMDAEDVRQLLSVIDTLQRPGHDHRFAQNRYAHRGAAQYDSQ